MVTLIFAVIVLGPMDVFKHGFYCDLPAYEEIGEDDIEYFDLAQQDYEAEFMPIKKYFAGFAIHLANIQEEGKGKLCLSIYDSNGDLLDEINTDICNIKDRQWYFIQTDAELQWGQIYKLHISAKECQVAPYLQIVHENRFTDENISGDLLLGYAYAEPTFTLQLKVLMGLFILAVWMLICTEISDHKKVCKKIRLAAVFLLLTGILSWNYMYNSMDNKNNLFQSFQKDSEALVLGKTAAEKEGVSIDNGGYGLGKYESASTLYIYEMTYPDDSNWSDGYSRNECCICLQANQYTRSVAAAGNFIQFSNGEFFQISRNYDSGTWLNVYLASDKILKKSKYGKLADIVFYDENHVQIEKGYFFGYKSQYGLQGKIFSKFAGRLSINSMHLLCSLLTAMVFVIIVMLLRCKYNLLLSVCFFVVFFLSPWVVNFARNLYWVEFTWFLPTAIGLFCAWKVVNRKCRIFSYCAVYIAVTIKCLCGYEYISVIMMGMISFLLVDFITAYVEQNRKLQKLLLQTIFILGSAACAGFITAICIHANLRGNGSILGGIKDIIVQDVLRRTNGGDLNDFSDILWESLNASIWEVYCKYFHFSTEIITGVAGNLFPVLCMTPLCIFAYDYKNRKLNVEWAALYAVFFLTSVSWFILAKSHSYIHTHMNYVLWYFGFVQVCIYIICSKVICLCNRTS